MKFYAFRRFLCGLLALLLTSQVHGQAETVEWAKTLLLATKPVKFPVTKIGLGISDPKKKIEARESYENLIRAIVVLGSFKEPSSAQLLIPFLDYPVIGGGSPLSSFKAANQEEDVAITRSEWPAFSALLDIPGSAKVVSAYALDINNPMHIRLAAFHALRYYTDRSEFNSVAKILNKELASSGPETKRWLKAVQDGECKYQGAFPVPTTR